MKHGSAEDQATLDQAAKKKSKPGGRFEMLVFDEADDKSQDKENGDPNPQHGEATVAEAGDAAAKSKSTSVRKRDAVSFSSFVEVVNEEGCRTEEKPLGTGGMEFCCCCCCSLFFLS